MVTVYGAGSTAEAMIAGVRRMHDMVVGTTPSGEAYCANDPELLNWVQATAAYGFLQAYHSYVRPLSLSERDSYYAEAFRLLLSTVLQVQRHRKPSFAMLFQAMAGRLESVARKRACSPQIKSQNVTNARAAI